MMAALMAACAPALGAGGASRPASRAVALLLVLSAVQQKTFATITTAVPPDEVECLFSFVPGGADVSVAVIAPATLGCELVDDVRVEFKLNRVKEVVFPDGDGSQWVPVLPSGAANEDGTARICVSNFHESCTYYVVTPATGLLDQAERLRS